MGLFESIHTCDSRRGAEIPEKGQKKNVVFSVQYHSWTVLIVWTAVPDMAYAPSQGEGDQQGATVLIGGFSERKEVASLGVAPNNVGGKNSYGW